jgi:hypothetical protein
MTMSLSRVVLVVVGVGLFRLLLILRLLAVGAAWFARISSDVGLEGTDGGDGVLVATLDRTILVPTLDLYRTVALGHVGWSYGRGRVLEEKSIKCLSSIINSCKVSNIKRGKETHI